MVHRYATVYFSFSMMKTNILKCSSLFSLLYSTERKSFEIHVFKLYFSNGLLFGDFGVALIFAFWLGFVLACIRSSEIISRRQMHIRIWASSLTFSLWLVLLRGCYD